MVVKILADCGIIGGDVSQVIKVFHSAEVGAIDADLRRTVRFSWRELVQHLSLHQADVEAKLLGCIREAVDSVLASCGRTRRAHSSANSSLVMSSSMVFVRAKRRRS